MSFFLIPNEWKSGDVITAQRMNATQNLIVTETELHNGVLSASYQDIEDAVRSGRTVMLFVDRSSGNYSAIFILSLLGIMAEPDFNHYEVVFGGYDEQISYSSDSPTGELRTSMETT